MISVDAVCTSLRETELKSLDDNHNAWNSICAWGPTAMLPVFQILGTDYEKFDITSCFINDSRKFDIFSKIDFIYNHSVASIKVGKGVKSEGELIVSGTKGSFWLQSKVPGRNCHLHFTEEF